MVKIDVKAFSEARYQKETGPSVTHAPVPEKMMTVGANVVRVLVSCLLGQNDCLWFRRDSGGA